MMTSSGGSGAAQPAPPVQLRDYDVTERLGSGSYGDVFKARRKTGARDVVAVKCVLRSKLCKAEQDNIIREIAILKKLKHEHIVEMVDFCWDASYIYIVMEYCGGGDLSRMIRTYHVLSETVCRRFLQQLASALRFLRTRNISHFDLKPQNILLTALHRPRLKLADFGFAQHVTEEETKSSIRGSPLYMAPEMVKRCGYDAKVDLWSVGVILFECLFGRAPYKSANMEELVRKIREGHPIEIPSSPRLSDACHDLLTRLLCTDPAKRIDFEEFFAHPFIDLEHMPSDESLAKAISLAEEAVRLDTAGQPTEALERYKQALEYFVPLANNERSAAKREALRKRTTEYIRRAEQLKEQISPNGSNTLKAKLQRRTVSENESYDELFKLSAGTPKLITALDIAKAAESYELEGKYPVALEKYQTSLGMLLPLLSNEPVGKRKTLLHSEITRWMNKAECIKDLLNIQEKVLADSLASDAGSEKQCIIQ